MGDGGVSDDVEKLQRWERAGGVWRVVSCGAQHAVVALCRCDGGEEVDRLTSADPALLAHVAGRTSSEDSWLPAADHAG